MPQLQAHVRGGELEVRARRKQDVIAGDCELGDQGVDGAQLDAGAPTRLSVEQSPPTPPR